MRQIWEIKTKQNNNKNNALNEPKMTIVCIGFEFDMVYVCQEYTLIVYMPIYYLEENKRSCEQ